MIENWKFKVKSVTIFINAADSYNDLRIKYYVTDIQYYNLNSCFAILEYTYVMNLRKISNE